MPGDESSVSGAARFEGPDHGNGDGGCPFDGFGSDSSRSSTFLCFESCLRFGGFSFECCQHRVFFDFLEAFFLIISDCSCSLRSHLSELE